MRISKAKKLPCATGVHCDHPVGSMNGRGRLRTRRFKCCWCGMESVGQVHAKHGKEVTRAVHC